MVGKVTQAIDVIEPKIPGGKVLHTSQASYRTRYELGDLALDDLITKYIFINLIPQIIAPLTLPVIAAGTATPHFIDITLYPNFDVDSAIITKTKSGRNYIRWNDMRVDEIIDISNNFTGWNVYLHTDDNVVSNEDIYIVLKP